MSAPILGVNVDHVATLRQARRASLPDPVAAAIVAVRAGAPVITAHLREDRRHIQDDDVLRLHEIAGGRLNLEMAVTPQMLRFAEQLGPPECCLVPEKRAELTTEGGLDVLAGETEVRAACQQLAALGTRVALFIDPVQQQVEAAARCGAVAVELHTGSYANAGVAAAAHELQRLVEAARIAVQLGLAVHAGHGLDYFNVKPVAAIRHIEELNIGHAIVAQAMICGFETAVRQMLDLLRAARP
ncbi:MAG: pyridoxine 5'-phosphate synthase [Steroidobacteraceae bacterium]